MLTATAIQPALPQSEPSGPPAACPRPMTEAEKKDFLQVFPHLDVEHAMVTGPSSHEYNCISWTVGETHQWFWPPAMYPGVSENQAFDRFYARYGYQPAPAGEIARWRNGSGLTHGCVAGPTHGPHWESKCGSMARIEHTLDELEGESYGHVDAYYTRISKESAPTVPGFEKTEISEADKNAVRDHAAAVPAPVRKRFEEAYAAWQAFRADPRVAVRPDPADHCKTGAFETIVHMGAAAIPLLMDRMVAGDFFCLRAVEAIQTRTPACLDAMSGPPPPRDVSEQTRATQTLMRWLGSR